MNESEAKALEFARYSALTGETEFMAFTPDDFVEDVAINGTTVRISAQNHIVRIEKILRITTFDEGVSSKLSLDRKLKSREIVDEISRDLMIV